MSSPLVRMTLVLLVPPDPPVHGEQGNENHGNEDELKLQQFHHLSLRSAKTARARRSNTKGMISDTEITLHEPLDKDA